MNRKHVWDRVVVHYGEIGLKGKNRVKFEQLLLRNIKAKLGELFVAGNREPGQLVLSLEADRDEVEDILRKIPGIAYFSFAQVSGVTIEELKKRAIDFLKDMEFGSFKVAARRRDKSHAFTSAELNNVVGEAIRKTYNKQVTMTNPDIILKIEVATKHAYISIQDIPGMGGMPTDAKQKVVALLSGGFDSPVAAYVMMKRGCEVIFVHFQNENQMAGAVEDKVRRIARQLAKYQITTKLYIIPFEELQKQIITKVDANHRMLIYRKFMMKIGSSIAEKHKARFLVVGDSLSQVASQTLENLEATYAEAEKPIFSPLIGMDKNEIMALARKIGTYELSALPYGDCCSYFLPKHPALRASAQLLEAHLAKFDVHALVNEACDKAKVMEW